MTAEKTIIFILQRWDSGLPMTPLRFVGMILLAAGAALSSRGMRSNSERRLSACDQLYLLFNSSVELYPNLPHSLCADFVSFDE